MKQLTTAIAFLVFILSGCEDNSSDDSGFDWQMLHDHDHDNNTEIVTEIVTHDIDAEGASGFYYDLVKKEETNSSGSWHISFQMLPISAGQSTYMMPSLVLGEVYAAGYTEITFDEMDSSPETFMQDYFQDPTVIQYGGSSEVLSYDPQTHVVSVSNPDRVFVVYEPVGHTTYKVQFIEYVSGFISFKYSPF